MVCIVIITRAKGDEIRVHIHNHTAKTLTHKNEKKRRKRKKRGGVKKEGRIRVQGGRGAWLLCWNSTHRPPFVPFPFHPPARGSFCVQKSSSYSLLPKTLDRHE